jgi:hypothetical protein
MSTLAHPPLRQAPPPIVEPTPLASAEIEELSPVTTRETNRWLFLLVIPFVLGAVFFGIAIGFDIEWPMAPAFLLGPLPLISAYIYLALSSDANNE